jgi:uncharacterized protein (DUF983 family)
MGVVRLDRTATLLGRGLGLRCPRCGVGKLFPPLGASLLRALSIRERCPNCGLRFEREPGYWLGAIYINYAVTVATGGGVALLLALRTDLGLWTEFAIVAGVALLVSLLFFRWSKGLWLAIDDLFDPR